MKLVLISIVVLFAVLTFVFLLFPDHIQVSRIKYIQASPEKIMALIRDTAGWKNWNRFYITGKTVQLRIDSNSADKFVTRWSKTDGKSFNGTFTVTAVQQGNVVEWTLDFHLHWYPWERMSAMFYERQLGPEMDISLNELKKLAERD